METITKKDMENKEIVKKAYKIYQEKGQSAVFNFAKKHNVGYAYCKSCETSSPSIEDECLVCGSPTVPECPVCNRTNISPDNDFPDTMKNCDDCGSEWVIGEGITLDARDELSLEETEKRGWNRIVTS